jgi:isoleucyl-tRNA synthetase
VPVVTNADVVLVVTNVSILHGQVLLTLTRCMAPLTPLFAELLYGNLAAALPPDQRQPSVHFLPFPQVTHVTH